MLFGIRHLLLGLLLAANVGAEPATQPGEPPRINGEVVGKPVRAEDINLAVRSVQHEIIYELVNGELLPAQQGPVPARLRCEVSLPPSLADLAYYRSVLTALEDDSGGDLLKPLRAGPGNAEVGVAVGGFKNNFRRPGPVMVDVPLPVFPRAPRTIARIAGRFTLYVPAEVRTFDIPLDKIGTIAAISKDVTFTLTSCRVLENNGVFDEKMRNVLENNGVFEVKMRIKGLREIQQDAALVPKIRAVIGLGDAPSSGHANAEFGTLHEGSTPDELTVQFAPGRDKLVKTIRLTVITKTLEIPLQYDIRSHPMM